MVRLALVFAALVLGATSQYQYSTTYSNQNSYQFNNGVGPQCWFSNSNGFNLSWTVDSTKNVNFNLQYPNYPTFASWIGVGFGNNSQNISLILIEVANSQVSIASAKMMNDKIQKETTNSLVSASGIVTGSTLTATFVKSLKDITDAALGQSCVQWNFYSTPRMTGTSQIPITKQICNVDQTCQYMGTQTAFGGQQMDQNPVYGQHMGQNGQMGYNGFAGYNDNTYNNQFQYQQGYQQGAPPMMNQQFNQPQGPNSFQYSTQHPNAAYQQQQQYYSTQGGFGNQDFYVQNPNYRFLDQDLQQRYEQNQNVFQQRMRDPSSTNQGLLTNQVQNPPMLTNQQQNEANYQRIQADYRANPNPNAGRTFTNNIYGYDYRSNPNQQFTYVSSNQNQYQPPQYQQRVPVAF